VFYLQRALVLQGRGWRHQESFHRNQLRDCLGEALAEEEAALMLDPDRIDEILNLKKYRRTMMDLKILWWELQRVLGV